MTKITNAADVIRIAEGRGFKVLVDPGPPPMPFLRGESSKTTPALLDALKAWRLEIIDLVASQQPKIIARVESINPDGSANCSVRQGPHQHQPAGPSERPEDDPKILRCIESDQELPPCSLGWMDDK